jgi:hypothetical protein
MSSERVISLVNTVFWFCVAMRAERRVGRLGLNVRAASRAFWVGLYMRIERRRGVGFVIVK